MSVSRAILGVFFLVVLMNFLAVDAQNVVCSQPRLVGQCRALLRRYYYDFTSNACKQFYYGGCGGNGNNFVRKSDCKAACVGN
ncbi:PREDICTED: kunitz-type serine protease inhibitor HCRG2-like [Bactrocera latifrons]|uniref:kunitz-type serine protease inhibitor HCRG2-like n=1 Tax=Bactrocera latifrons TaxID=174628 RepID=UPI0008DE9C2C|nr:PREDICTED: kunitz-type serine protease inhibitor HCRG2-like [Bactrocera latifrons]